MQYLVEAVWASRSALSANIDLYNLAFVQWDRQKDWSPWNCILLSKEETSAHLEVEDVHTVCTCLNNINLSFVERKSVLGQPLSASTRRNSDSVSLLNRPP